MLILKANVADKKKQSFFKITKSVNYFWSDMKDAHSKKKTSKKIYKNSHSVFVLII
jgi:hypothetical protein